MCCLKPLSLWQLVTGNCYKVLWKKAYVWQERRERKRRPLNDALCSIHSSLLIRNLSPVTLSLSLLSSTLHSTGIFLLAFKQAHISTLLKGFPHTLCPHDGYHPSSLNYFIHKILEYVHLIPAFSTQCSFFHY